MRAVVRSRPIHHFSESTTTVFGSNYRVAALLVLLVIFLQPCVGQQSVPPGLRPWSRSASQTPDGFYFQPEILGEDYTQVTPKQVLDDIAIARRVGARALRFGVSWHETEPRPGKYNWSKLDLIINITHQQGMAVLPYICYTPRWAAAKPADPEFWSQPPQKPQQFVAFARAAATRYKGKVLAWGLWNEPDGVYWKGSPHALGQMIRNAARAIRQADPSAGVWMGGLAQGDDEFFRAIEASDHVDRVVNAIGLHGYPGTWDARSPDQYYSQQLSAMRRDIKSDGAAADLWADENGYADYRYSDRSASRDVDVPIFYAYEHTPEYQAVMLWRDHMDVLASCTASLMGWYRIHDLPSSTGVIGDDNNRHLGIVDVSGREKPAFRALRFYDQLFNEPTKCLDEKVNVKSQSGVVLHVVEKQNGEVVVAGWLPNAAPEQVHDKSGRAKDTRPPELAEVQFPAGYKFARVRTYKVTGELISDEKLERTSSPFVLHNISLTGSEVAIAVLSGAATSH